MRNVQVTKIFDAVTIAASGSSTSAEIRLNNMRGYMSLQVEITGDGTAKAEYQLSNDSSAYVEPSTASDILSSFVKTSGPGSNGKDIFKITPMIARSMKIVFTETGGANSITVSAWLAVQ